MPDLLLLFGAALTGLLGGAHCAAMCGGIATSLPAAGRPSWTAALQVHLGRVGGYVVAGAAAGGLGHGILDLADSRLLGIVSRTLVGLALIAIAIRISGLARGLRGPGALPGRALFKALQPLYRSVLPANTPARRVAAGMLWGWLPCGLSASVLTAAWLRTGAVQGGLTLLAFGLGGLPLMMSLSWSGARLGQRLQRPAWRQTGAALILLAGFTTLLAPWLMEVPALHGVLRALGCGTPTVT
jgi:hypothetical protein